MLVGCASLMHFRSDHCYICFRIVPMPANEGANEEREHKEESSSDAR